MYLLYLLSVDHGVLLQNIVVKSFSISDGHNGNSMVHPYKMALKSLLRKKMVKYRYTKYSYIIYG